MPLSKGVRLFKFAIISSIFSLLKANFSLTSNEVDLWLIPQQWISKLFFYPIFLIFILSSCASLNTSVQTYNLEGKLSYVSDEISAIFSIKIFGYEENLQILLFDPINGDLIENLQGSGKYWNKINMKNVDIMDSLPEPLQIKSFLLNQCLKTPSCELNFVDNDKDIRIKMILRNV